jgi:hypothetical protein
MINYADIIDYEIYGAKNADNNEIKCEIGNEKSDNIEYTETKYDTDTTTSQIKIHHKLDEICNISNGIATLRDAIFIHDNKLYDEPCWRELTTGRNNKWAMFPYKLNAETDVKRNNKIAIIPEDEFKIANPNTYKYLCENREELNKRDKFGVVCVWANSIT